ncbi:MAG: lysozyme inhibitor LprI family protein [Aliidongia sp.]
MRRCLLATLGTLAVAIGGGPALAAGPSFDCSRAAAPVEKLICGSPALSALDDKLAAAFRARHDAADDAGRASLQQEERRWAQGRAAACNIPVKGEVAEPQRPAAEACLTGQYNTRLAELAVAAPTPTVAAAAPPAPPKASPEPKPMPVAAPAKPAAPPAPVLAHSSLPAHGAGETLVTVPGFGRYSVSVKSDQGTALQLIDRMAGPGPVQGIAGARDGRVDAFLDRGAYKLRLTADPRGSGNAEISAQGSAELEPEPVRLMELKPVIGELGDHEQRSYWLSVKDRGTYVFEAAGRYLSELRLWRDGAWMVDATPVSTIHDPGAGQPQAVLQLSAQLEPGTYKLTAYGGAGQPWAAGSTAKPFLLRWGVPALGDADRSVHEASPLGIDRFLVPKTIRQVRLAIDQSEHAVVTVQPYRPDRPFAPGGSRAAIEKTSRDPVAVVTPSTESDEAAEASPDDSGSDADSGSGADSDQSPDTPAKPATAGADPEGRWLVTVERTPGARYRLEILNQDSDELALPVDAGGGNYALAVVKPGAGDDTIDPTALVLKDESKVAAASVLELDTALPWRRHFNLLTPQEMLIHTTHPLDLKVEGSGAQADFIVAPTLVAHARHDAGVPKPKPSGGIWTLDPGYYLLTARPLHEANGVLTLSLYASTAAAPVKDSPRLPAPLFPKLAVVAKPAYSLHSLPREGDGYGLELRSLPLDLAQNFAFETTPGSTVELPVKLAEPGTLRLTAEDGSDLPIAVDGQPAAPHPDVAAGSHKLGLTGPAGKMSYLSLGFLPESRKPDAKLSPIPADQTSPPELPKRSPGPPVFMDLAQDQSSTFAVPVEHAALYRVETLGLVETAGALRTRILPSLVSDQAGGIGRNFLLQQYLREGDYQLTVKTAGKSYGRVGVAIGETPVSDQGVLETDLPSRLTLAPGQAALYRFHIETEGDYSLHAQGLGHGFAMRLDDEDGWPLLAPGSAAETELKFRPGDYRMILLPQPVEARAVTILHRVEPPAERSGHGPFDAAFATDLENRWMEPEVGQARTPDHWRFTLPAPAELTLSVGSGMQAVLMGPGESKVGITVTDKPWTGSLPAGAYVVDVTSAAPNNRVDYTLRLDTTELVAGQRRSIQAPAELKVSLAGDRQIELASFGAADVRGRLYDASGKLVAANDDRDNDWNFAISGRFAPGLYTLRVDPVGAKTAATEIGLSQPEEIIEKAAVFDTPVSYGDGKIHVVPLPDSKPGSLLLLGAEAPVPVGLALEAKDSTGDWQRVAATTGISPYLAVPRGTAGRQYRVRVWPVDHGKTPVALTASAAAPATASESSLASGTALAVVKLGGRSVAALAVTLDRPGVLQLVEVPAGLTWTGTAETGLSRDPFGSLVAPASMLWLVGTEPMKLAAKRIDPAAAPMRVTLGPGAALQLPLGDDRDHLALWRAEGQGGQPGIAVASDGSGPLLMAAGPDSGALAGAYGFAPAGLAKPVLKLWQAGAEQDALPVTVTRIGFATPRKLAATIGVTDGKLAKREAVELDLPAGPKRLALTVPAEAAIVLLQGSVPQRLIRSAGTAADIVETTAEAVLVLNTQDAEAPFTVSVEPIAAVAAALVPGQILTRYGAVPAVLHLSAAEGPSLPLRAAGAVRALIAVDAVGKVTRGDAAVAGPGSLIDIAVKPGLVALSRDAASDAPAKPDLEVTPPAAVALDGKHKTLRLAAGPARLVHVETEAPIVLRSRSAKAPTLFAAGAQLNLVLGEGKSADLEIEPAGGGVLSGMARFDAVTPTPITDGLGPKLRLPPGQSRLFSFTVKEERAIGVGVRASVDIASCWLLAADGTEIGRGLVHMQTLKPGTYLLAVDVPADGVAVDIEPALVGLTPPGKGPPDEVKAQYLALTGAQQK